MDSGEIISNIISICGAIFFIFRIWLVQFKLKDELQFRKDYLSRYMCLYFCIGMILQFKNDIFNIIIGAALPLMIISFIGWDTLFFVKFKRRTYWKKNYGWLIIERLTMHPPMMIVALYWWIDGLKAHIILVNGIFSIIVAIILVFGAFLMWDKRWTEKYIAPTGMNILISAILSVVGFSIYILLF
ncbi:MAG: hypothetical protein ACTSRZ_10345 [Promethearchaeota archaeon]